MARQTYATYICAEDSRMQIEASSNCTGLYPVAGRWPQAKTVRFSSQKIRCSKPVQAVLARYQRIEGDGRTLVLGITNHLSGAGIRGSMLRPHDRGY